MNQLFNRVLAIGILLGVGLSLSSWNPRVNFGSRGVASLSPELLGHPALLKTQFGQLMFANAYNDIISPMHPRLLAAALEITRPFAYQPQIAHDWDDILSMDVGAFGRQLDGAMNHAGLQHQSYRQVLQQRYDGILGRDLIGQDGPKRSVFSTIRPMFAGGVGDDSSVPWGASELSLDRELARTRASILEEPAARVGPYLPHCGAVTSASTVACVGVRELRVGPLATRIQARNINRGGERFHTGEERHVEYSTGRQRTARVSYESDAAKYERALYDYREQKGERAYIAK